MHKACHADNKCLKSISMWVEGLAVIFCGYYYFTLSLVESRLNGELQRMKDERRDLEVEMEHLKGNHAHLRHQFEKLKPSIVGHVPLEEYKKTLENMQGQVYIMCTILYYLLLEHASVYHTTYNNYTTTFCI